MIHELPYAMKLYCIIEQKHHLFGQVNSTKIPFIYECPCGEYRVNVDDLKYENYDTIDYQVMIGNNVLFD